MEFLGPQGWNSHVHRESPGNPESATHSLRTPSLRIDCMRDPCARACIAAGAPPPFLPPVRRGVAALLPRSLRQRGALLKGVLPTEWDLTATPREPPGPPVGIHKGSTIRDCPIVLFATGISRSRGQNGLSPVQWHVPKDSLVQWMFAGIVGGIFQWILTSASPWCAIFCPGYAPSRYYACCLHSPGNASICPCVTG